ncbi:MAG: Coq4 family protein [Pseudomonadota bacterium]
MANIARAEDFDRTKFSFATHCPEELIEWVEGYPTPPAPPLRPLHACVSMAKLIANKEDTRQVFEVIYALDGGRSRETFERWVKSPYGEKVVSQPIKLEADLADRERLRELPEGSVGRAYLDFMERENLTPEGVLGAAEEIGADYTSPTQFEEYRRMTIHQEVIHDLWHVLTGYGRDALGELCVLSFSHAQLGSPGVRMIVSVGAMVAGLERPRQPIGKAVREARARGKRADWLLNEDIEALFREPLNAARARLNLGAPTVYDAIPDEVKATLLKPKVKKTQSERENAGAAAAA